mmetsp:Transcript_24454/g.70563  ORF Transcript_24454/g.70563 Transcript_24454/m.70563 type:complete len:126 (-) Transcript_24454:1025-1402(-)
MKHTQGSSDGWMSHADPTRHKPTTIRTHTDTHSIAQHTVRCTGRGGNKEGYMYTPPSHLTQPGPARNTHTHTPTHTLAAAQGPPSRLYEGFPLGRGVAELYWVAGTRVCDWARLGLAVDQFCPTR